MGIDLDDGQPRLRLLPEPTAEQRAAGLRVQIIEAEDRHGPNSRRVLELKRKFNVAMTAAIKAAR